MKVFIIANERAVELFDALLNCGHWCDLSHGQVMEGHEGKTEGLKFTIHDDGTWNLMYEDGRSEVDSTDISGPLTKAAGLAIVPILKESIRKQ